MKTHVFHGNKCNNKKTHTFSIGPMENIIKTQMFRRTLWKTYRKHKLSLETNGNQEEKHRFSMGTNGKHYENTGFPGEPKQITMKTHVSNGNQLKTP